MYTTQPFTPTASGPPTFGDEVSEVLPLVDTVCVAGPPVLLAWAGTVLFALMLAGPFALLVTFVVVLVAAAALVALADTVFVAGPPVLVLWAGTVLLALMLAGPFALLATFIVVLVAAALLVALAGAILASPYLLVRHLRLRLAKRRRVSEVSAPIATVVAMRAAR